VRQRGKMKNHTGALMRYKNWSRIKKIAKAKKPLEEELSIKRVFLSR